MRLFSVLVIFGFAVAACTPLEGGDISAGDSVSPPAALLGRFTTPPAAIAQPLAQEPTIITPEAAPLVETPLVETPLVETPPVETPPVETPPVETPPAYSTPLVTALRRVDPLLIEPQGTVERLLGQTPAADPLSGFQICSPLADILLEDLPRLISDGYHPPPVYYSDARHPAIDIAFYNWKGLRQIAGTPVQSVLPGRVAVAEVDTFPMGNVVIVETRSDQLPEDLRQSLDMAGDRSLYTLYAHMQDDSLRVQREQTVTPCETLGRVGKSGNTLAAHLHLEMRLGPQGASFIGFQGYLEEATVQERANYRAWATSGQFLHFDPLRVLLFEVGYTPTPGVIHITRP